MVLQLLQSNRTICNRGYSQIGERMKNKSSPLYGTALDPRNGGYGTQC